MNQIPSFTLTLTLFSLLSLLFLPRTALAVDENFTICSVPRYCGKLNIKFPFFIEEQTEPRCGYPGFKIHCRNKTIPILSLPDGNYTINDIFYQTQSLHVSKAERDAVCSHSIRNISLPEDRYYLDARTSREMVLLFSCNLTSQWSWELSKYKIDCAGESESNSTLALFKDDPELNFGSGFCGERVGAAVGFDHRGGGGVEGLLNRGFVLNWTASNCSVCEGSGGWCGFDYKSYHFKCFCPDRPHAARCSPAAISFVSKRTTEITRSSLTVKRHRLNPEGDSYV
ncbi:hypothetical protein V6N11_030819 [Hibiscus sabdariffa]|uniref:non-specific serine/threonine protein kinase n=1 Tax=Hibiscus sabdariffa TaxID=183260 RepID=A0ABR2AH68_9ROSI